MCRLIPPPVQTGSGSSGWLATASQPNVPKKNDRHPVRAGGGLDLREILGKGAGSAGCHVARGFAAGTVKPLPLVEIGAGTSFQNGKERNEAATALSALILQGLAGLAWASALGTVGAACLDLGR